MFPVIKAQWLKDKRKPLTVILLLLASIAFTLIFSDTNQQTKMIIPIFSSESNSSEVEEKWEALLNRDDTFTFVITDEEVVREDIAEGKREVAITLMQNDYQVITANDITNLQLIEQYVHTVFTEEAQIEATAGSQK